jgi:hypothetical protein
MFNRNNLKCYFLKKKWRKKPQNCRKTTICKKQTNFARNGTRSPRRPPLINFRCLKSITTQLKTIGLLQYWWKQDWTMLCGPHCSQSSTMLNNIVTPDSSVNNVGRTTLFNLVKLQAHNFYACRPCACSSRCTTSCKPFI